jgi:hypothetical protein
VAYDIVQTTFLLSMAANSASDISATQPELQAYLTTARHAGGRHAWQCRQPDMGTQTSTIGAAAGRASLNARNVWAADREAYTAGRSR